jgi:hypothetical protein
LLQPGEQITKAIFNAESVRYFNALMKTVRKSLSFEARVARRIRSRKVADAKLRARQAQGKLRRFVITNFRKDETIAALSLRRGECNRCGACCELVFKCPFLKKNADGSSLCGIYENRPNSCRLFPIEQRDIQEVRGTCSYYFIEKPVKPLPKVDFPLPFSNRRSTIGNRQ